MGGGGGSQFLYKFFTINFLFTLFSCKCLVETVNSVHYCSFYALLQTILIFMLVCVKIMALFAAGVTWYIYAVGCILSEDYFHT